MALRIRRLLCNIKSSNYITTSLRSFSLTTVNMEKALDILKSNPYYEKYAARIADLQKTSPEEFVQRVEEHQKMKEGNKKKLASVDTRQYSSVLNPKEALKGDFATQEKRLSDILKLELVQDKNTFEIQTIWEEYHKNKEVISATIPKDLYADLQVNMKQWSTFVFPLPRDQGYEFIMCQCYGHTVHFTPLLAFQVHKENAPECLTMVHYTELLDKGIILMRGEFDKNALSGREAQCLANQFQMYYSGKDAAKLQLLTAFTASPDTFKHMDLITQLENISLT